MTQHEQRLREAWVCSHCGYDPGNGPTWCSKGCGSDYNQMHKVDLSQDRKQLLKEIRSRMPEKKEDIDDESPQHGYNAAIYAVEEILTSLEGGEDD